MANLSLALGEGAGRGGGQRAPPGWGPRTLGWELAQLQQWEDGEGFQGHWVPRGDIGSRDKLPPSAPVCEPRADPSAVGIRFGVWLMLWVALCPPKICTHILTPLL